MMWYDDAGWVGWSFLMFSMLLLWVLLGWRIWAVLRTGAGTDNVERSPEQVLRHRFAAGELDADEYHRAEAALALRDDLAGQAPLR